jgi:hypothetical protein
MLSENLLKSAALALERKRSNEELRHLSAPETRHRCLNLGMPENAAIKKCALRVSYAAHMEQPASDAANAARMRSMDERSMDVVVHTTEDTPVGDGGPICEVAHVEVAIEAASAGAKVAAD